MVDAQDDVTDAKDDVADTGAQEPSDPGFQYELWNGSMNDQDLTDGGGSGCSVGTRTEGGWGWLAGVCAWLLLRRRRRAPDECR